MKSIFQPIALRRPWARVLLAGGCVALAALILVWSPRGAEELGTAASGQAQETWTIPSGQPATVEALKQEAADVADHTIKAFPGDPDSYALKGNACLFNGKTAEAVKSWEKCLELDPARAGAYAGISQVAYEAGRFEQVVAACRKALKYNTNMPDVHLRLVRALTSLGRAEESIAAAQQAVKLWPQSVDAHLVLGQGHMQSQEYAKARECFLRAAEIRPDHTQAYYGLAAASAKLGQRDLARQYQERFRALMAAEKTDYAAWILSRSAQTELSDQRARAAAIYNGAAGIYRKHGNVRQARRMRKRAGFIAPRTMRRR